MNGPPSMWTCVARAGEGKKASKRSAAPFHHRCGGSRASGDRARLPIPPTFEVLYLDFAGLAAHGFAAQGLAAFLAFGAQGFFTAQGLAAQGFAAAAEVR